MSLRLGRRNAPRLLKLAMIQTSVRIALTVFDNQHLGFIYLYDTGLRFGTESEGHITSEATEGTYGGVDGS